MTAVGYVPHILHQPLAKSTLADKRGALEVLQGTGDDLTRRCRVLIHQHDQRHFFIPRVITRLIDIIAACGLTTRLDDRLIPVHEEVDDLQGLLHYTSAVAAQVDDELAGVAVIIEVVEGVTESLRRALCELTESDITHGQGERVGLDDCRITDGLEMDILAHDGDLKRFRHSFALQLQHDGRTGYAAQVIADLTHTQPLGLLAVHGDDSVACEHSCALGRLAFVRIDDISQKRIF